MSAYNIGDRYDGRTITDIFEHPDTALTLTLSDGQIIEVYPDDADFECSYCSKDKPHEHWEFVTGPNVHLFHVLISGCTAEQAAQVMTERLGHEEDYGFSYNSIDWKKAP